ncbi:hypothetical protein FA95DRAFT_1604348 [Auriscalpium vulgare]|uniref:Uncharacterized protein n=1 Tax=Auriscalpium vulgare TaxID=40419 RepID=A0ACB8S0A4_9AGAM|nr:hypothetical protein FA95DRAFT_1604348 [Auriscalpium vulgare]
MSKLLDLDPSLLVLQPEELDFFKHTAGIQDDVELREHILAVQKRAYEVFPYSTIRSFTFARLTISRMPGYEDVLAIGKQNKDAILLDAGCCFGADVRKAVVDGWPADRVLATDIIPEFWDMGHELFRSTPSTFPVHFIPGNLFDPLHLAPAPPPLSPPSHPPVLASLTNLTPLHGRTTAIHASALFHLFPEAQQRALARLLGSLLAPGPGAAIFGWSTGRAESGVVEFEGGVSHPRLFCFAPADWRALWEDVFGEGTVRVLAVNREFEGVGLRLKGGEVLMRMEWCVTRL